MARLLHYYAHPGQRSSTANRAMWNAARNTEGITRVDLYAEYPRHHIDIDKEQQRLVDHDVVLIQFPVFWYSAPSLVKEWIDLTFEYGFAYGEGGQQLAGKWLMLAVTTSGPEEAYRFDGYQHYPLRTFLTPFEQTARLSKMHFAAPYVQYGALATDPAPHAAGFVRLIEAIRDDRYDLAAAEAADTVSHQTLPILPGA